MIRIFCLKKHTCYILDICFLGEGTNLVSLWAGLPPGTSWWRPPAWPRCPPPGSASQPARRKMFKLSLVWVLCPIVYNIRSYCEYSITQRILNRTQRYEVWTNLQVLHYLLCFLEFGLHILQTTLKNYDHVDTLKCTLYIVQRASQSFIMYTFL